jgi:mitofusin
LTSLTVPLDSDRLSCRVLSAIGSTRSLLSDLRTFNNEHWVVRYPVLEDQPQTPGVRRPTSRRSLSIADDSSFRADVVVSPARGGLVRSITLPAVLEKEEDVPADDTPEPFPSTPDLLDFKVFRLDLKLGTHSSSPATLVTQLEKASIAKLIDERIGTALNHTDKLRARVEDTSSKVLVTGDLNAGKSTFVNAILGRSVMPVDQQPCTTAFCEVHDAAEIGGVEEIHVVKEGVTYDLSDESTFTRTSLSDLDEIVSENENGQQILKVYLSDPRSPAPSFLHNGVVDISLIDAPGLNRDSVKTTAVFARQEEIDVVVFVVSAENHFTLSAQEFLKTASNEKAYLFIVVNKFEGIRDKKKCRRLILEQVKALSPQTYEDAEDLVHFVDSASTASPPSDDESFKNLESALRTFVLTKRAKSKLQPASTYLTRLLSDINFLVSANAIVAQSEATKAEEDLRKSRPHLEKMTKGREAADDTLEAVEEEGTRTAISNAKAKLTEALENVARGASSIKLPAYPGVLGIWEWAGEVRRVMLSSLDLAVKLTEDDARVTTSDGVHHIEQIGEEHLPEDIAKSKRVFIPEAMFSARNSKSARRKSSNNAIAGVGIGLAQRPDLLNTTFLDIYDFHHQFAMVFSDEKDMDVVGSPTALGVASVGLGALTMVGGQALGVRGLIEGVVRVTDLLGNESTRKWIAPIAGAVAIGMTWYVILELPTTVPRTIGRRIKQSLRDAAASGESADWVEVNAERVGRETRKVLRLASWDLKQRIASAIDEREKEVKIAEEVKRTSENAADWMVQAKDRTGQVLEQVQAVSATPVP